MTLNFALEVPEEFDVLACRITAQNGNFSDGEQHYLPILDNEVLVNTTLPITLHTAGTHTFSLKEQGKTGRPYRLTFELTANPVWYAVQALPGLTEPKHDNATEISAAYYANEVIEHCNLTLVANNEEDVSMKDETIFGLQMDNMEENLSSYWTSEQPFALNSLYVILTDNWTQVFERTGIGSTDIRGTVGRGFLSDGSRYMCRKYLGDEANDPDYYYENIPLIRLSEMYYIYAECVDLAESGQYIDIVRNARGISRVNNYQINPFTQERQRTEALQNEYSKEFFAEGQYFYFLKRNNISSFYRCPFQRMIYYVLPIPDDEVEYGLVEVKDDVEEQN